MTPQESAMLDDLLRKIQQTRLTEKDPDAQAAIEDVAGNNPDSLYILAQTVLVQNVALGHAKSRLDQLRQQLADLEQQQSRPARATSFLGALLGQEDPPPPQRPQVMPPQASYTAPAYQPVQGYAPAQPNFSPFGAGVGFGGPSSFLRSAATTAAGVAAGALAFEGVESLLHGLGHGGGYGIGGFGGGGFGRPIEENVVNNYYEGAQNPSGDLHEHHRHEAFFDERPDAAPSGDRANLDTASYDTSASDLGRTDSGSGHAFTGNDASDFTSLDDSNDISSDNGSGDDGGNFDSI